jgi:hypothetical protein
MVVSSVTLSIGEAFPPTGVTCRGTLGGAAIKGQGKGACTFSIPRTAAGKQLVVTVTVAYRSATKTTTVRYTVVRGSGVRIVSITPAEVVQGAQVRVTATVSPPATRCTLVVQNGSQRVTAPAQTSRAGQLAWTLRIAANATPGRWQAVVDCGTSGRVTGSFVVVAALPPPMLSVGDASTAEGNSGTVQLAFPVTLSRAATTSVTVGYTTANGTAVAGGDYTAATGTVTFSPGETSKAIVVSVLGDTAVEPDETLTVSLSNPVGATIADGSAVGTIRNDDVQRPLSGHYAGLTAQGYDVGFDVAADGMSLSNVHLSVDADCGKYGGISFGGTWPSSIALNPSDWSFSDALGANASDGSAFRIYFRGNLTLDGKANGSVQGELVLQSFGITCQSGAVPFSASRG